MSFICYKSLFKIKKMKVDEKLLNRIREALMHIDNIEEKPMFGGVCFMVNDKMCICARNDRMMCRVGPKKYEACLEEIGCEPMIHGKRLMKGYVFIAEEGYRNKEDFDRWIKLSLDYNKEVK